MTWTKLGTEFWKECIHHGLSDAAARTHGEAIGYLYDVEETTCTIPKRAVRTFTGSENAAAAIEDLVAIHWWADRGERWEVIHHAEVIRQSLAAQQKQRATSKKTSAKYRQAKAETVEGAPDGSGAVTRHVTPNADRQTDSLKGPDHTATCKHGVDQGDNPDSYFTDGMACSACARERKTA